VLAGVIGTRQHYGEKGVGFTPANSKGLVLAGNLSHPQHKWSYLCGRLAYVARSHRWTQPLEKFESFKRFQMKKLLT
jgi:hypothetical protein